MRVVAIIAAGGRGTRVGGAVPKQLRLLGGRTLLEHTVEPFDRSDRVGALVVVLPADLAGAPPAGLERLSTPLRVVAGGARRQDSVAAGADAVPADTDIVLVHDAARPFCTGELISRTIDAAAESGAAIPALHAGDTVKEGTTADDGQAVVRVTLAREHIYLAQTPQAFRLDVLRDAVALGRSGVDATDEAMLAERAGHRVRLVDGDPRNTKVTTPEDLALAADLVVRAGSRPDAARVGFGYDSHRMVEGRPLILGGVPVPHDRGLLGHSDADAVCHAVTDAILGGVAAGDIGRHFPDTDPRWKDASSIELLRVAVGFVRERGYTVGNVDVVVIAERPKLGPHRGAMCERLASALDVDVGQVSVKAKTAEGMDGIGRGDAIAVHAVAMLVACHR